jgi:hypothetical protein
MEIEVKDYVKNVEKAEDVNEHKVYTFEDLVKKIEKSGRNIREGKNLMEFFVAWKSGMDGMEYQKACRDEWD